MSDLITYDNVAFKEETKWNWSIYFDQISEVMSLL